MGAAGNQAGNVGHINHKNSADFVSDVREQLEVDGTGISRSTGNDQLGLILLSHVPDLVVVNEAGFVVHIIGDNIIVLTGDIGGAAVGQVAAVSQAHAHESVAGLQERQLNCHVGLGAGVGLDIGKFRTKQVLSPLDAQGLDLVHILAAAVVALAGQTFGILIGQDGAHSGDHCSGSEVLGCDQLQAVLLTLQLPAHHGRQFGIVVCNKTDGVDRFTIHSKYSFFH